MTPPLSEEGRRAAEWELLRALCSGALAGPTRQEVLGFLSDYAFHDPICQAIFGAVDNIGREGTTILRRELPAQLTRRGFPDVDFEKLFTPPPLSSKQIVERARELVSAPNAEWVGSRGRTPNSV